MITSKPISSIHYCDIDALHYKLKDMYENNCFIFYMAIPHIAESDEKKNHIHIFIIPNGRIDTDKLRDALNFIDDEKLTEPIRCLPFHASKFQDFYLYATHDEDYLESKGQFRKYHYNDDAIYCSDKQYLYELKCTIDFTKSKKQTQVVSLCAMGMDFDEMVATNMIPVQLINQYEKLYQYTAMYYNKRSHKANGEIKKGAI